MAVCLRQQPMIWDPADDHARIGHLAHALHNQYITSFRAPSVFVPAILTFFLVLKICEVGSCMMHDAHVASLPTMLRLQI